MAYAVWTFSEQGFYEAGLVDEYCEIGIDTLEFWVLS